LLLDDVDTIRDCSCCCVTKQRV